MTWSQTRYRHPRRTYSVVGNQLTVAKPANRCSECNGTGRRHLDGKPIAPYQHCRACLGRGALATIRRADDA